MPKKKKIGCLCKKSKTDERKIINDMARSVIKIVNSENKKYIQKWMETEFEKKLSECVERFVEKEFKEEILPVLISHINTKVDNLRGVTKEQVTECVREVLISALDKLAEGA